MGKKFSKKTLALPDAGSDEETAYWTGGLKAPVKQGNGKKGEIG
jgi:hypothetical protein